MNESSPALLSAVESTGRDLPGQPLLYRDLFELAPDALLVVSAQGRIELVNAQAEQLFGYARAALIGLPVEMLAPERLRARPGGAFMPVETAADGPEASAGPEPWGRRADGSEFPIEVSLSLLGEQRNAHRMMAVRDISASIAVQRQLRKQAQSLKRSNEELEQFAYIASHDLQSPLRGIAGFAGLLKSRHQNELSETASEYLELILQSVKHMASLISDLLSFSKVGREDRAFVATDCEQLFAEVCGRLSELIQSRGATVSHDPLPVIAGIPYELGQVLQNLLSNAIKFQPGEHPRVHVSARAEGSGWRFSVRDFGIGIEKAHQEQIFRIFQRLHTADEFEGTGIGLAICQKVVHRHGGRIWVESEPGQGATFYFSLKGLPAAP